MGPAQAHRRLPLPTLPAPLAVLAAVAALASGLAACGGDPTGPIPVCALATPLPFGSELAGALEDGDGRRAGARIDYYAVVANDTTFLTLRMTSADFDPFIYLIRATGQTIGQAFHPTGDPDVETVTLGRAIGPGCFLVGASAWATDARGAYTLAADTAAVPPAE